MSHRDRTDSRAALAAGPRQTRPAPRLALARRAVVRRAAPRGGRPAGLDLARPLRRTVHRPQPARAAPVDPEHEPLPGGDRELPGHRRPGEGRGVPARRHQGQPHPVRRRRHGRRLRGVRRPHRRRHQRLGRPQVGDRDRCRTPSWRSPASTTAAPTSTRRNAASSTAPRTSCRPTRPASRTSICWPRRRSPRPRPPATCATAPTRTPRRPSRA